MKDKNLKFALALLEQVANEPALDPVLRRALLKARQDLRKLQRGGTRIDRREIFRVVGSVSHSLWLALESTRDNGRPVD